LTPEQTIAAVHVYFSMILAMIIRESSVTLQL